MEEIKNHVQKIRKGDRNALSRAITLVESANPIHQKKAEKIIDKCLPFSGKSFRIGISGMPGVGKSTFIESFGKYLIQKGKKIAVLAVDPSSLYSKGSILGDKARMAKLSAEKNAFIRPTPTSGALGGVAEKTRESIVLCEAAGFDIILIETVGVGQSETAVFSMVDVFILLQITGAGDELQGIKKGIAENADIILINKADGDNILKANLAKSQLESALSMFPKKKSGWSPKVLTCSAIEKTGLDETWRMLLDFLKLVKNNKTFSQRRKEQITYWLNQTILQQLKNQFLKDPDINRELKKYKDAIFENEISPYIVSKKILKMYFSKYKIK